jgi:hypothetical protein
MALRGDYPPAGVAFVPGATVRDLAETGLHRNTINNIEVGRYMGDPKSLAIIEKILTRAGVEFTDGDAPGVRLKKRGSKS